MLYADDYIIEILSKLPSECAYLDYKEIPYLKNHYHDLIKDVIAMLNSEEAIGHDKAIVFGVSDDIPHCLRGIDSFLANACEKFDDASYQTIFDRITPRPHITVGSVTFDNQVFGYVLMPADMNREWIYEVKETYIANSGSSYSSKHAVFVGQAFTRRGSKNYVMMQQDRDHLKSICTAPQAINWIPNGSISSTTEMEPILIAAIIGCWNEVNQNDCALIEMLSAIPYGIWIQSLRKMHENGDSSVVFCENTWRVQDPEMILKTFGIQLYDVHITKIAQIIERVFSDYDAKYDLKSSDRFAAPIYKKFPQYSASVRHGLSRFLAIAGNFPEQFPSCSSWKLKKMVDDMIGKVIESNDWRILATMEQNFQLLAEASPIYFAKSVQKAISTTDSGLCAYLLESENLFGVQFYGAQLVYALTLIACKQAFFSQACFSTFLILEKRPEHLAELTSVFLPWAPKTEAPFAQRIAIIKQFFNEDNDLAWKFLYSLLPEQTTASGAFVPPKYLICKIEEEATQLSAYWEESNAYMELAIEQGSNHKERLLELIGFLDKVPKNIFCKLIAQVEATAENYADEDKYIFWNKLLNIVCRHRRFPDADWTMPGEALSAIEILADKIAPKDRRVRIRRLFQNETYDILPTQYDSFDEKNAALSSLRLKELDWCYHTYGLESLMCCIETFDSVQFVGALLAELSFTDECDSNLYKWLTSSNDKRQALAKEYLQARFRAHGTSWLNAKLKGYDQETIAILLSSIPLTQETMSLAEQFLPDQIDEYWKRVSVWGLERNSNVDYIIRKLLHYQRPLVALELINAMHREKHFLGGDIIFKTLEALFTTQPNDIIQHNAYMVVSLIEWLGENWDDEKVLLLESWYFKLFKSYGSKGPKKLYMTLANDPNFFMEMLCHTFKGRHETKKETSDEASKIAKHSFDILFHWNIAPGTNEAGTMDTNKLNTWFAHVKAASQEKDRYEIAMRLIGAAFFYSPPDPDGLFIHRTVAGLLHQEGDELRNGYYNKVIKSRGAHFVDPTGAPEFELEKQYNEYAMQIDALGLFRFAETLRLLAKFYHSEAIENIEENKMLRDVK